MPFTEPETPPLPDKIEYLSAYPNPFGNSVFLEFKIASPAPVMVKVYNIKGQLIKNWEYLIWKQEFITFRRMTRIINSATLLPEYI